MTGRLIQARERAGAPGGSRSLQAIWNPIADALEGYLAPQPTRASASLRPFGDAPDWTTQSKVRAECEPLVVQASDSTAR